jgi:antitoxin component HigA of HigAB toxin-antitoxin module
MHYPARKQKLIEQAKKNNAGPDVIEAIKTLPDQEFKSQDDLIRVGSQLRHQR